MNDAINVEVIEENQTHKMTDRRTTTINYQVPFADTDAMRVVHHANYARYFELARTRFMEVHDRPYIEYMRQELFAAVTRIDTRFYQALRFNDLIQIDCWPRWVKTVSFGFGYSIQREGSQVATGITEHVLVDGEGRPLRLPPEFKTVLRRLMIDVEPGPSGSVPFNHD